MDSAEQTLDDLLRVFSKPTFSAKTLDQPGTLSGYRALVTELRQQSLNAIDSQEFRSPEMMTIPVAAFFADCAIAISLSSSLQRTLSEFIQNKKPGKGVSQEDTHLLVDLWGQVEASKALYEFSVRHLNQARVKSGDKSIKGISLRAQCRVLASGLEQLLLLLAQKMGDHHSLVAVAELTDWVVGLLRAPEYDSLRDAVNEELYGLVA